MRAGREAGRIYRVVPVDRKPRSIRNLATLDDAGLAAALDDPNGWVRDTAMRLLVEHDAKASADEIRQISLQGHHPTGRLQALATLDVLGVLDAATVRAALTDAHPEVARFAAERAGSRAAADSAMGEALVALADHPSPRVRLGVALGLGDWDDERAGRALGRVLVRDGDDPWLRTAALSSARPRAADVLREAMAAAGGADLPPAVREPLLTLTFREGKGRAAAALLRRLARPVEDDHRGARAAEAAALFEAAGAAGYDVEAFLASVPDADARPLRDGLAALLASARATARDATAAEDDRRAAARLLGASPLGHTENVEVLASLIGPDQPPALRESAARALAAADPDGAGARLLVEWPSYPPSLRSAVLDLLLARAASAAALLDAVEAGTLRAGEVPPAARQALRNHPDAGLKRRAEAIFTAGESSRAEVLGTFRDALKGLPAGDPTAGRAAFARVCATCHRAGGLGVDVGPDLAALTDRSVEAYLTAILDPNRAVEAPYVEYVVQTTAGRVLTGRIAAETPNSLTLLRAEAQQDVLLRRDVEALASSGRSLMPEGLEKDLTPKDVADLIAFLNEGGPPPKRFEGNAPTVIAPGPDGALALTARHAAIHGPSLVFESRYGNLGYWSSPDDRAAWSVEVPRAGRFEVAVEYACDGPAAGNRLILSAGAESITWTVPATASWDEYLRTTIGAVELPAGRVRVEVRAEGEVRGALLDLKAITLRPVE